MHVHQQARQLIDAGANERALGLLVGHLGAHPDDAEAWALGGEAFGAMGRFDEAHGALRQALDLDPGHLGALIARGLTLQHEGREDDAEAAFIEAERRHPTDPGPPCRLGWLYLRRAHHDQARAAMGRALRRAPGLVSALSGLAVILEHSGESARASEVLGPWVHKPEPHPLLAFAWGRAMVTTRRATEALPVLRRALAHAVQRTDRVNLLHLIGDCLAADGEHAGAFASYTEGNLLRARAFDGPRHVDAVRTMTRHFPLPDLAKPSPGRSRALLVVGVPRSGTSLVETMLSRHPAIAPGGELETWRHLALEAGERSGSQPWYRRPERVGTSLLDDLARTYARTLDGIDADAARVVDKMPNNQLHLGLAAWALPDVVVVHCMRDPADTAWSCYRLPFQDGLSFSTSLTGLACWIRAERELMAHWKQTLDVPILDVRYEQLVRDPEAQLRPVIEAAGLPWDPAVADHRGTGRTVATASYHQVRQPLYTSSVGRSVPYHHLMGEFFEAWEALDATRAA